MKLTNGQQEIAIKLRGLFAKKPGTDPVDWEEFLSPRGVKEDSPPSSFEHYVDLTRAMAQMLDGSSSLAHPKRMQEIFNDAWQAYARYWGTEHGRIVLDALGGDQDVLDQVKRHKNGRVVINRILERVRDTDPGVDVQVLDILAEEMI